MSGATCHRFVFYSVSLQLRNINLMNQLLKHQWSSPGALVALAPCLLACMLTAAVRVQALAQAAKERAEAARQRRARDAAEFVARPSLYPVVRHLAEAAVLPLAAGHCAVCTKRLLPGDPRKLPKVPKSMEVCTLRQQRGLSTAPPAVLPCPSIIRIRCVSRPAQGVLQHVYDNVSHAPCCHPLGNDTPGRAAAAGA